MGTANGVLTSPFETEKYIFHQQIKTEPTKHSLNHMYKLPKKTKKRIQTELQSLSKPAINCTKIFF